MGNGYGVGKGGMEGGWCWDGMMEWDRMRVVVIDWVAMMIFFFYHLFHFFLNLFLSFSFLSYSSFDFVFLFLFFVCLFIIFLFPIFVFFSSSFFSHHHQVATTVFTPIEYAFVGE